MVRVLLFSLFVLFPVAVFSCDMEVKEIVLNEWEIGYDLNDSADLNIWISNYIRNSERSLFSERKLFLVPVLLKGVDMWSYKLYINTSKNYKDLYITINDYVMGSPLNMRIYTLSNKYEVFWLIGNFESSRPITFVPHNVHQNLEGFDKRKIYVLKE